MSFSGDVKEELAKHISPARHCQIAELSMILNCCGIVKNSGNGSPELEVRSENSVVLRKCFTLLKKTFNINDSVLKDYSELQGKTGYYQFSLTSVQDVESILEACKWEKNVDGFLERPETISSLLIKSSCCKRAALRGAYLTIGSMSNPQRSYHLEFVCASEKQAMQLCEILSGFGLEAKIVQRKKYYVVYMKEGSAIVDLLNIMEAHVALMELENLRILKDISNSVNRRVNCEAANIVKTVNAANRQVADIELIKEKKGISALPENLREAAVLRLEHPDATLSELSQMMNPPIGKSGMNHRLRKLSEIAEEIREKEEISRGE